MFFLLFVYLRPLPEPLRLLLVPLELDELLVELLPLLLLDALLLVPAGRLLLLELLARLLELLFPVRPLELLPVPLGRVLLLELLTRPLLPLLPWELLPLFTRPLLLLPLDEPLLVFGRAELPPLLGAGGLLPLPELMLPALGFGLTVALGASLLPLLLGAGGGVPPLKWLAG